MKKKPYLKKKKVSNFLNHDVIDYIRKHRSLLWLIIPAFVLHMVMILPSGSNLCLGGKCGIHFWGIHSHDAMWHLQLIAVSFKSIPFEVPTYAGAVLSGYNILMDIIVYLFTLIGISPLFMFFKVIPIVWFVSLTVLTIAYARSFHKSVTFVFITLFLVYFAGHFGYLLQIYQEGSIFKGSQSFSMQSMNVLLNPQFALTLPIVIAQLIFLKKQDFSKKNTVIMGILTFFSLGLKFYGGVVSILISGWYLVDYLIQKKDFVKTIGHGAIIGILAMISVIVFYNPFAAKSSSVFIFAPFATVHSMIEAPNMFYSPNLVFARYYLYEHGWSLRLIAIELYSTLLYVLVNFGSRILGLGYVLYRLIKRQASKFEVYLLATTTISFALSVFFIQSGGWWNTIQFGYYSIFLSTLLTAHALFSITQKRQALGLIIVIVFFVISIPSSVRAVIEFVTPNTLVISREELEALNVLKDLPKGVVFTSFDAKDSSQLDYDYTGYVSAFSGKPLYLAQLGQLELVGIEASDRIQKVEEYDCRIFDETHYIYYKRDQDNTILLRCSHLLNENYNLIFENEEVQLFQRM